MKIMEEEEEEEVNHHHHHHQESSNSSSSSKSSSSNSSSPEKMKTKTKAKTMKTTTQMEEEESESSPLRSPIQPRHDKNEKEKPFSSSSPLQSRHVEKPMSPHLQSRHEKKEKEKPMSPHLQSLQEEKEKPMSPHLQIRHEEKENPFSPQVHSCHEEKEKEKPMSPPLLLLPSHQQHYPQPQRQPPPVNPQYSTAMVTMDRKSYGFSNLRSPSLEKKILPPPLPPMETTHETVSPKPQSPVIVVNRSIRDELSAVSKMDSEDGDGFHGGRRRDVEDGSNQKQPRRHLSSSSVLSRQRNEEMVNKAALGFRVCALVFCLVSFSVMAADKTRGWAGDSFDRYKEYRYCLSVNTIGFVYASFQAYDLAYNLITEQHVLPFYIRYYFDFSMDQILTYLLISASSSAATRVDDWQTNWGKDEFTVMASASVGMSFMAFVAFAFSSLISGYNLCNRNHDNN